MAYSRAIFDGWINGDDAENFSRSSSSGWLVQQGSTVPAVDWAGVAIPLEHVATRRIDAAVALEWSGSAIVTADAPPIAVEWQRAFDAQLLVAPLEWTGEVFFHSDNFDRANGALNTGGGWSSSAWTIVDNRARSAAEDVYWHGNPDSPDYTLRARIATLSATNNDYVAIGGRVFDGSSGYFARIIRKSAGTDELEVAIRNGSSAFVRLTHITHEWVDGDFLQLTLDGNGITASVLDGSDRSLKATVSTSDAVWQEITGSPMLRAGSTGSYLDDYEAGWLGGYKNLSWLLVGAVRDTSARIAFALTHAGEVKVRYATSKSGGALVSPTTTPGVTVDGSTDFTGKIDIAGLSAATTYHFQVLVDDVPKNYDTANLPFPVIETAPSDSYSGQIAVAFGSCHQGNGTIMGALANKSPDLFVHLGDITYPTSVPSSLAGYRALFRKAFANGLRGGNHTGTANHLNRRTRREMPGLYIRDDHEGGTASAEQALREHLLRGNPDPGTTDEIYYTHRWGSIEFFALDTRGNRTTSSFLGATQMTWFKAALAASTATFKVIMSSGPVHGYAQSDSWYSDSDWRDDRDEIYDHIIANNITGVIWWTGDSHFSGAYLNKRYTAGVAANWNFWEFASSAFDSSSPVVPTSGQTIGATAASRSGGVSTIGTNGTHGLVVGEPGVISSVADTTFNGTFPVASVPSSASFTYAQAGQPDVSPGTTGGGYVEAEAVQWQRGNTRQFAIATFDTAAAVPTLSISSYGEAGTLLTARAAGGATVNATLDLTLDDMGEVISSDAVTFDVPATALEWIAAVAIDAPSVAFETIVPVELNAATVPLEHVLGLRSDIAVPLEWIGAIGVTADAAAFPLEWGGQLAFDLRSPGAPLEWLAAVAIEAVPLPLESAAWVGTVYADAVIPFDIARGTQVDHRLPIEYGGFEQEFIQGNFDAWHVPRRPNVWHVQRTRRVLA